MADDPVDKFLTEQKTLEAHRHELIKEVLRQKEAAIKAFDEKLHRMVAIKLMSRELAATSPARKRFLREARSVFH